MAAPPDPGAILKGLRKALAGPRLLLGDGDEPMFPKGAAGTKLASAAVAEGYLIVHEERTKVGRKTVTTKRGELTEKGRSHVLAVDDPKPVLEALASTLRSLGQAAPTNPLSAFQAAVNEAKADCVKTIEQAFAKQQEAVAGAIARMETAVNASLSASKPAVFDPAPALAAVESAAKRVTALPMAPSLPRAGDVKEAIVAFVARWAAQNFTGCRFDEAWKHLTESRPGLSVGEFQDAMRALYEAHKIRLGGWPGAQDEIPQPELAFFVSHKVMYYAHPTH